jgi:hypothetical protein
LYTSLFGRIVLLFIFIFFPMDTTPMDPQAAPVVPMPAEGGAMPVVMPEGEMPAMAPEGDMPASPEPMPAGQ